MRGRKLTLECGYPAEATADVGEAATSPSDAIVYDEKTSQPGLPAALLLVEGWHWMPLSEAIALATGIRPCASQHPGKEADVDDDDECEWG